MMRRFYIWIFSIAAIVLIYLVINRLNSREPMSVEGPVGQIAADINSSRSGGQAGRLDDVDIMDMKRTVYLHRNQNGDVDREFGFEQVNRAEGSFWEIEKPFINFFRKDLTCFISSDKGNIQTETVGGNPSPRDGSMNGNVVIRIVPKGHSDIKESFIYLDDIFFEMEKSQASSTGPIRFVSEDIELKGRGLAFVFNGDKERLEFLRIKDLEGLRIRTTSKVLMFASGEKDMLETANNDDSKILDRQAVSEGGDKTREAKDAYVQQILTEEKSGLYRWIFNKNVVIDCPEQLVLADEFFVNNILVKGTDTQASGSGVLPVEEDFILPGTEEVDHVGLYNVRSAAGRTEDLVDINIRCDGGILVTPMDSEIKPEAISAGETVTGGRGLARYGDPKGRATLEAKQIDYCALTNVAELTGDCRGTMPRTTADFQQRYSIWAPRIRAELAGSNRANSSALVSGLEHLTADGGVVRLAVEKLQNKKLLGFTKLLCLQFDYEPKEQMWVATGPGRFEVDNSTLTEKEAENLAAKQEMQTDKFSLQKPCYAYVENFDKLVHYLDINRIIADGGNNRINIRYLPVINGQTGQLVKVDVGKVDMQFAEAKRGAKELSKLQATNGVTYWEEGRKSSFGRKRDIQLDGSGLLYNREDSMITVWGSQSQGCFLNGVNVDGIKYNVKTGRLEETRVLGPGIIW